MRVQGLPRQKCLGPPSPWQEVTAIPHSQAAAAQLTMTQRPAADATAYTEMGFRVKRQPPLWLPGCMPAGLPDI